MLRNKNLSLRQRARFIKKLSFLLESGIPLVESLCIVRDREHLEKVKRSIDKVIKNIQEGKQIHHSFALEKDSLIDTSSLAFIECGESTGNMTNCCTLLSLDLVHKLDEKQRLIGALIYPSCVLLFALILILSLLMFVFPKILPLLTTAGTSLPLPTRILIKFSEYAVSYSLSACIFIALFASAISFGYTKSKSLKFFVQSVVFQIPLYSGIKAKIKIRSLSRTVSLYLQSGFTLTESLYQIIKNEKAIIYNNALCDILTNIKNGKRFSKELSKYPKLFHKEFVQFVAIGEESGTMAKTIRQASDILNEDIRELEKRMFSLIEPGLMLLLGLIVGFVALSFLSPLYSITTSLSQNAP